MTEVSLYTDAIDELSTWHFSEPTTNRKGGKTVFILRNANSLCPPAIQLTTDNDPRLRTSGLCRHDDSSRLNLDFNIGCRSLELFFESVDEYLPKVAFENCSEWFKKTLTESEIKNMYKPLMTRANNSQNPPTVKTKLTASGANATRVWKVTGCKDGKCTYNEGSIDDITKNNSYWANISVTGMYFLSRQFGCTVSTTDILVFPTVKQSIPFMTEIALREESDEPETILKKY